MQAIRSANVSANAIVLNSALSAYARNRPPLRTPARQCCWDFSPKPTRPGCGHDELGARAAQNRRAAALVQHCVFILFIFSEHARGVEESDRSKGDDSNDATSDVPIAVLDVNDTRTSDLFRSRRVL